MKNILLLSFTTFALSSFAQVHSYTFQHETGQPMEVSQYPDAVITNHVVMDDMVKPAKIKIPFPFKFNGQLQDSVGISENGFIWFGSTPAPLMADIINPIGDLLPNTVTGIVAAFASDLHPATINGTTTQIRSGLVGTAPMRELIIEWKNTSRLETIRSNTAPDTISFQIKLYQFMNRIEVAYMQAGLNNDYTTMAQVGLRGANVDDFNARTTEPTGSNWNRTAKATTNSAMCELSPTHYPMFGDLFVWMPAEPTGMKEEVAPQLSIYPNPAKENVTVQLSNSEQSTVRLLDATGRLCEQQSFSGSCQLNLQNRTPGLYFIQIETLDRATQTQKIVLE